MSCSLLQFGTGSCFKDLPIARCRSHQDRHGDCLRPHDSRARNCGANLDTLLLSYQSTEMNEIPAPITLNTAYQRIPPLFHPFLNPLKPNPPQASQGLPLPPGPPSFPPLEHPTKTAPPSRRPLPGLRRAHPAAQLLAPPASPPRPPSLPLEHPCTPPLWPPPGRNPRGAHPRPLPMPGLARGCRGRVPLGWGATPGLQRLGGSRSANPADAGVAGRAGPPRGRVPLGIGLLSGWRSATCPPLASCESTGYRPLLPCHSSSTLGRSLGP